MSPLTLNNLGILYSDTGRLADAETAYTEALAIYRDLAAARSRRLPALCRRHAEQSREPLQRHRPAGRRRQGLQRGAAIHRDSPPRDPGAYRPYVAGTLNNLGNLYSDTGRLADADEGLQRGADDPPRPRRA